MPYEEARLYAPEPELRAETEKTETKKTELTWICLLCYKKVAYNEQCEGCNA